MTRAVFSPDALKRTIRNRLVAAKQARALSLPSKGIAPADVERALTAASGALDRIKNITKRNALVALGTVITPSETKGFQTTVIQLRQAILGIDLDRRDDVISKTEALTRLKAIAEDPKIAEAEQKVAADLCSRLATVDLDEVNFVHLWNPW